MILLKTFKQYAFSGHSVFAINGTVKYLPFSGLNKYDFM
jgi:hypothetical protein